jgi:hypothetical protein
MNLGDIAQMLQPQPQGMPSQGMPPQGEPQGLADVAQQDACGPQPPMPNYYSPQAVRDAYMAWKMCKSGA